MLQTATLNRGLGLGLGLRVRAGLKLAALAPVIARAIGQALLRCDGGGASRKRANGR